MKEYTIYVTEEIARKAMEKGCPIEISGFSSTWTDDGIPFFEMKREKIDDGQKITFTVYGAIPTAEQVCGWLRKEKDINVIIGCTYNFKYIYEFFSTSKSAANETEWSEEIPTYEEAILKAIDHAIYLIDLL